MKRKLILFFAIVVVAVSCNKIDLNPLSEGSSENWYSNESELQMNVAALFKLNYWVDAIGSFGEGINDANTDDFTSRYGAGEVATGTMTSQSVTGTWQNAYKCIAIANGILNNLKKGEKEVTKEKLEIFAANARFVRASQYSKLIFLYGDVPYYTNTLSINEAFSKARTAKESILDSIFIDYDYAATHLPLKYGSSENQFATKGAALAMKARIALHMGKWAIARDAAKACMDLNVYDLYPDYNKLFLPTTRQNVETIFSNPRSVELNVYLNAFTAQLVLSRIVGGFANGGPSWDLLCSYLCKDGLPIDESPLYDPHEPFKNRDPRCAATIVEFGSKWLGYKYQPHPDSLTTLNYNTGKYVSNTDSRGVNQYAQYNGLVLRKWMDESWIDRLADPENIVIRYADVLLMYAEAMIELGAINQSVLDAMNKVRSRAYGVTYNQTNSYPVITSTNQAQLRKTLRIERHMEFAFEGLRLADIIRWKLAEKVLNKPIYYMLDVADLREKVVKPGLWFFPQTTPIDEDGIPDFSAMFNAGLIRKMIDRKFDASRQYLWPIPAVEIQINPNIVQNPNW